MPFLYQVELPPQILQRGFWIYAWKIRGPSSENLCYVGMTGDNTGVAQSAFNRASAHFGFNENANQIRKRLAEKGFEPEQCQTIRFLVYGPIFPYTHSEPNTPTFHDCRRKVASLENTLWHLFEEGGYIMLNKEPNTGSGLDQEIWEQAEAIFAKHI
jgi:hypothetical protein